MRLDLVHQQIGLPARLLFGHAAAFLREDEQPGCNTRDDDQNEENGPQRRYQDFARSFHVECDQKIDQRQNGADHADKKRQHAEIAADMGVQKRDDSLRQCLAEPGEKLMGDARLRLAAIAAAGFERATQRADGSRVGRAVRHVLGLEMMLADRATDHLLAAPILPRRAGNIETALRRPGDEGSHHEGDGERKERRKRLQRRAQKAAKCRNADDRCGEHGADADRIDVIEMSALEFDARGTESQRLVDHEIGDQCAHPRHRHDGVKSKRVLQHLENAELHQHERDGYVEHQPNHAAGMTVSKAREEIRPGDGARIGVGHIDLELGDDDKRAGEGERHLRRGEHVFEGDEIHARRLDRFRQRHEMLDGEERQERSSQKLKHPGNDPAGTRRQIGHPPGALAGRAARRQKPQEVDLLADLGDQRKDDGGGGSEQHEIERSPADAGDPGELGPAFERCAINGRDKDEGQEMQHDPCWLRPELKPADESDAMRHQRNHDQRARARSL